MNLSKIKLILLKVATKGLATRPPGSMHSSNINAETYKKFASRDNSA